MLRTTLASLVFALAPAMLGNPAAAVPIGPGAFAPGATVVDFEGQSSTALPSVPNLEFVREGNPNQPGWLAGSAPFIDSLFGENLYGNLVSTSFSDLAVEFTTPVGAAGAWVGQIQNFLDTSAPSLTVAAFGLGGALLEEVVVDLPAPNTGPVFVGFAATDGIARLEWRGGNTGFFGVDDITFGDAAPSAAIPEPSAALLFLLGGSAVLPAVGVGRRR